MESWTFTTTLIDVPLPPDTYPRITSYPGYSTNRLECEEARGSESACRLDVISPLEQDDAQQTQDQQGQQAPSRLGLLTLTPFPGELRRNNQEEGRQSCARPNLIQQNKDSTQEQPQNDLQRPRQTHDQSIGTAPAEGVSE